MCQKKILTILLLLFLLFPSFSADGYQDVTNDFLNTTNQMQQSKNSTQTSPNSKDNLNSESKMQNNLSSNLMQSELESMNAWELLENLEKSIASLQSKATTLQLLSENLNFELNNMKIELLNSKNTCKNLKIALTSNKDDTSEIIKVAGELQSQIEELNDRILLSEKKLNNSHKISNISFPIVFASGMATGVGCFMIYKAAIDNDNELLKNGLTITSIGLASFIGTEIVFNFGKSPKLKLW